MSPARGYGELLGNRRFLLYEASASAASVGYSVYAIAVPWLALRTTGSLVLVGLVLFVEYGVYTLTFLVAPLVDRARDKRTVFLLCYPTQAVVAALVGWALLAHALAAPLLLAAVAFLSLLWDFTWTANNIVPRLLVEEDQLFRAQGLGGLLGGATQVGGFVAGAALLVLLGPAGGMLLYAALLALGFGVAAFVPLRSPGPVGPAGGYRRDLREGWKRFLGGRDRSLLHLGTAEVARGFFVAAPTLLITLIVARVLTGGAAAYGELFVAWVVGGVAIGLVLGEWNPRRRVGRILVGAAATEGALLLVSVDLARWAVPSLVAWFLVGAAGTAYVSSVSTFLRGAYPAEEVGRVTSNLYLFTGASSAVGAVLLGEAASHWDPVLFALLAGAGLLLVSALLLFLPGVRRLSF